MSSGSAYRVRARRLWPCCVKHVNKQQPRDAPLMRTAQADRQLAAVRWCSAPRRTRDGRRRPADVAIAGVKLPHARSRRRRAVQRHRREQVLDTSACGSRVHWVTGQRGHGERRFVWVAVAPTSRRHSASDDEREGGLGRACERWVVVQHVERELRRKQRARVEVRPPEPALVLRLPQHFVVEEVLEVRASQREEDVRVHLGMREKIVPRGDAPSSATWGLGETNVNE